MRTYAKAYKLQDLRQFPNWTERKLEGEEDLTDDSLVFIWDDFTVTTGHFDGKDKGYLYDDVTPEWQEFCKTTLNFEIPEDVRKMMEQQEAAEREAAEQAAAEQAKAGQGDAEQSNA